MIGCYVPANPFATTVSADDITTVSFTTTAAHNLRIVGLLVAGGLMLAIPTVLVAAWNGLQVGGLFVGLEPSALRLSLLVHGVPESLGQIAGTTAGLGLAVQTVRRLSLDQPFSIRPIVWWTLTAIVLTVTAAILESTVTPVVAKEAFL